MRRFLTFPLRSLLVLVLSSASLAPAQPHALVEHTFPTPGEIRRPDRTLQRMESGPVVIAYSPDGRVLAVAGGDNVIRLWEARTGEQGTGELQHTLKGHTGRIWAVAFSADGKSIFSAADDRTVKTWDAGTGALTHSTPDVVKGRAGVFRSGNQPRLAEITSDQVKLWSNETGETFFSVGEPGKLVVATALAPDEKTLFVATGEGSILVREPDEQKPARWLEAGKTVLALAASATHLAAGCSDGSVKIWALADTESSRELKAHSGAVRALTFSPKGEQLASAGADKTVKVWDTATGALLCSQEGHATEVVAVAVNPNGQKMASADASGIVNYWTVPLPPLPPGDLDKIAAAVPAKAATPKQPRRLLVFWRADAILHKSGVPAANHALELLGKKTGAFATDFSRDYAALNPVVLARYDAIVLNSTAHLVIPESAKKALLDFVARGGGVIGIHAAIDTFKSWPEGAAIIGATFGGHPWGPAGSWAVKIEDPKHLLVRAFGGKDFRMHDEFYEMAEPFTRADRRVLLTLDISDEKTAHPGTEPLHREDRDFAVAWIKHAGPARVFYCCFGHLADPFFDPAVLQFYLDGIQYVLGDLAVDEAPPK